MSVYQTECIKIELLFFFFFSVREAVLARDSLMYCNDCAENVAHLSSTVTQM